MTADSIPLIEAGTSGDRPALHAEGSWSWISWPNRHAPGGREQHRGGRITLRQGGTPLAVGEIIAADLATWESDVHQALAQVAPWARVLSILSAVPNYETSARHALTYGERAAEGDEDAADWLNRNSTADERAAARAGSGEPALGLPPVTETRFPVLASSIAERQEREAARCRMVALAAAPAPRPDLGPTWVRTDDPDERLDAWLALQLLHGWRASADQRDALVTGARETGLTETAISDATGLARTTLARITAD
ncbi:hypothetical protein [Streptomyces vinaceus]|uniref:hypothetical protein n=1 Tax=Streptomyces vinaceus TaxID=1960 RepID=UPI0037F44C03